MLRKFTIGLIAIFGALGATAVVLSPAKVSPQVIQTAVIRTSDLLERAWQLPVATTFNRKVVWQSNGSLCGPASVANAFRSLGEKPATEADVLAGTGRCWIGICVLGLTLDELAEVARKHTKRRVTVLRDLSAEDFQAHLRHVNDPDRRYIINFSRERIFGAGVGHHSPVGGYLEAEDLVLVLDVNPDFQPWLVERSRLFSAMNTVDGEKKRGLLLIQ
jgi:Phytochelatin synthase